MLGLKVYNYINGADMHTKLRKRWQRRWTYLIGSRGASLRIRLRTHLTGLDLRLDSRLNHFFNYILVQRGFVDVVDGSRVLLDLILENHPHHVLHAFVRRCHVLVKACDATFQIRDSIAHRIDFFVWIGTRSTFLILYPLVLFRNLNVNFSIVRCPALQHRLPQTSKSFPIKRHINHIDCCHTHHLLRNSERTTYAYQMN